jgi:hypothetical protein
MNIISIVSLFLISFIFYSCEPRVKDNIENGNDMTEVQKRLTELAIRDAKNRNIKLDFSNESIEEVENILSAVHDEYNKTKSDKNLNDIALEYSAYIITVIEKNFEKGKLVRNDPVFGEDSYTFYWRGGAYYIYGWCLKRIIEGEEDNIWLKYKLSILQNTNNK